MAYCEEFKERKHFFRKRGYQTIFNIKKMDKFLS